MTPTLGALACVALACSVNLGSRSESENRAAKKANLSQPWHAQQHPAQAALNQTGGGVADWTNAAAETPKFRS